MASIKELKDDINYRTYDLINECFTFKMYHPDSGGRADQAISDLIRLRNELIERVNHPERAGEESIREHFRSIRKDLKRLGDIVTDLGNDG